VCSVHYRADITYLVSFPWRRKIGFGGECQVHNVHQNATIFKVLVSAKIINVFDIENRERGLLPVEKVRTIESADALIDTGATGLLLPKAMIAQLRLRHFRTRQDRRIGGIVALPMYCALRLTLQGRGCVLDVGEIDDSLPVLIGQVPLEPLDFVFDPKGQRLIANPEHGGEHIMDVFVA
jgi:predicted aspartyl protease